jgi:hypothetical protein
VGADVVEDGGESAGGEGASLRKESKWGFEDSRDADSYQFWLSVKLSAYTIMALTGGNPDLEERLLLLVHPWLPPPFPGPGGPKTPLYL